MAWFGAAGLGTATAVFAQSTPAAAAGQCLCCNLAHCPANTSMSYCQAHQNYEWSCRVCSGGACVTCLCCEANGNSLSALDCRPT
ncbi:hypothetical protein [Fodinicola acaciae]|uniref:hypothetical protein n=1 Tax=Fodinicola acaciae TaxID=2681555 RepID=UPI0013D2BEB0|nr:hypothetical protein [Fodinicola acaciae]